jgi:hypothetical protein
VRWDSTSLRWVEKPFGGSPVLSIRRDRRTAVALGTLGRSDATRSERRGRRNGRSPGGCPFKVGGWVPLRGTYRLELMAPGQRCFLWLSGRVEPGMYAIGALTGVVLDNSYGSGKYWRDLVKMPRAAGEVQ